MDTYDVIGGGAAGLSAGLTLSRVRRSVLILDAGRPRNATAEASHNFPTRDGIAPADLTRLGTAEVTGYGGTVLPARVASAGRDGERFAVVRDQPIGVLAARDVAVVDGEVTGLEITDDRLTGVRLATGVVLARRALVVAPQFVADAGPLSDLGLATVEHPSGAGRHVEAGPAGQTSAPGVWVAGNVTDLMAGGVGAAAGGFTAAAAINADLVAEDTRRAVRERAGGFAAAVEAGLAECLAGDRRHGLAEFMAGGGR